ncbi:response regulator [Solitalea longa]|uniref:Response regulator n=1 Tax=Solitalea longa TaxID=2079460 RepID=A0A2S5A465_9SPHI|nr:response regulator [Solitalea longa]POY37326.1 response regulator [Solitalea longa]
MQEKLLIFLIDDDVDDHEVFSIALEDILPLAECVFALDGFYALQKINDDADFSPNFIFIDINMPRMNGIQCLKEIKKIPHLKHIPIYMYSTSAEPPIVEECINSGACGFIKKEVSIADLQNKLCEIFLNIQLLPNK